MSTHDQHARNSSDDVCLRIVRDSFPEWHVAMRADPTYQKLACLDWWAYVSFEEYKRFYAVASAAPGYDAWPVTKPFYAA